MVEFSRYYINFIRKFFANLWDFLKTVFQAFADFFYHNIIEYFNDLIVASNKFTFLDWIAEFLILILTVVFCVFLFLRIHQLMRRYLRFVKRELEKEELLDEISLLNARMTELVNERNQIMAMKLGANGTEGEKETSEPKKDEKKAPGDIRFPKLAAVDRKYKNKITTVTMAPNDQIGLPELVDRFINFAASQLNLYYTQKNVSIFFAGLATSKILILEGISGTGKTSLPYAMGKFFGNDASIISVQPSWRDRAEMIGYLNEFTKRFNETEFLRSLYETTYREDLNFIILDEMNLARIEYYFAEFLSILEMPNINEWKIDIVPDVWPNDPKNFEGGKITVPQNVWFIGTANRDDSTFTITDKVYDRATSIEMNVRATFIDAPYTEGINFSYEYLAQLFDDAINDNPFDVKTMEKLLQLDAYITDKFKITFGNRIMKQIKTFVPVYVACGGNELDGLDYMVMRKILRKFEALNLSFLQNELRELIVYLEKTFGKNSFQESKQYINELLKQV